MDQNLEWWNKTEALISEKSVLKHPFYQAWTRGELSREDLAHYARQYYFQESNFPRYLSAIHSNCSDRKTRQTLLENLNHEEAGIENHAELWLDFSSEVGADRKSVITAQAEAKTLECVTAFDSLARNGHWTQGLAALYAYEAQQPKVAQTKMEGLQSRYGVHSPKALKFFKVHEEMDQWHSESEKNILLAEAKQNPTLKNGIEMAVSKACDAMNALLDGVCQARGISCQMAMVN